MALHLTPRERDYVERAIVPTGTTIRTNHTSCPSGTDTRRRLYITGDTSGKVMFCHNCGQGGAIRLGPRIRTATGVLPAPTGVAPYIAPSASPMPDLGKLWIKAWGLDPGDEYWYEDGSTGEYGLVFPFTDGHQIRWLHPGAILKWQTFGAPKLNVEDDDVLVCEDALSARKWEQAGASHGAICLFGAKLSKAHVETWNRNTMYLVWLDNDQARIDEVAELIAKHGSVYSDKVVLAQGGTDPKRYTKQELVDVRDKARKLCGTPTVDGKPYHTLQVPIPDQRVRAGLGVKRNPS